MLISKRIAHMVLHSARSTGALFEMSKFGRLILRVEYSVRTLTSVLQPVGWNFATSGSSNLQVVNNKILAVSSTRV